MRFLNKLADHPALILGGSAVVFLLLGCWQDGIELDSTTYSILARNIAEHGHWFKLTYTAYYKEFTTHPPLVMWLTAIVFKLFGATDSTSRIIGALFTLGAVLMAYKLGREIKDKNYGFLCGLVLLLTYNFMKIGNSTLLDVPLSFFILTVLWGLVRIDNRRDDPAAYFITGLALGAAFLTKGVVSAPIWLSLGLYVLIFRRNWLASGKFWFIPLIAVAMVLLYLAGDYIFAEGAFSHSYLELVRKHFQGTKTANGEPWWVFTSRYVHLYLPFVVLMPFGLYFVFRKRTVQLYPLVFTLLLYFLFYSNAAYLYYHYFCTSYALSAPLAALPLYLWLKEKHVRAIEKYFPILWLAAAIAVTVSGLRINEIRSPEIYNATAKMQTYLDSREHRHGLFVKPGVPVWDYVAKTKWYWRSDIKPVGDFDTALELLTTDPEFVYIFVPAKNAVDSHELSEMGLTRYYRNNEIEIYIPAQPEDDEPSG